MIKILKKIKYPLTIVIIILLTFVFINLNKKLNYNKYKNIDQNDTNIVLNNDEEEIKTTELCNVDIKGAIKKPNVYLVDCNSTINDVIGIAGGLNNNADTSVTNLAKKINNEMVIIIYTKEEVKNSNIVDTVIKVVEKECVCPNIQNDGCINTEITDNISNSESLVNINSATLEILMSLPGIGESKAKAIIKYRETNGSFQNIEEIQNVDGIGNKLYEDIKAYITT